MSVKKCLELPSAVQPSFHFFVFFTFISSCTLLFFFLFFFAVDTFGAFSTVCTYKQTHTQFSFCLSFPSSLSVYLSVCLLYVYVCVCLWCENRHARTHTHTHTQYIWYENCDIFFEHCLHAEQERWCWCWFSNCCAGQGGGDQRRPADLSCTADAQTLLPQALWTCHWLHAHLLGKQVQGEEACVLCDVTLQLHTCVMKTTHLCHVKKNHTLVSCHKNHTLVSCHENHTLLLWHTAA